MGVKAIEASNYGASEKAMSKLTPKQQKFIGELLADPEMSPKAAAENAGYKHPAVAGVKLMKNPTIKRAVAKEKHERKDKLDLKSQDLLRELARMILLDVRSFVDHEGEHRPLEDLPEDVTRALRKVKKKERYGKEGELLGTDWEYEGYDKIKAIELYGKHLGLWEDRVSFDGQLTIDVIQNLVAVSEGQKPKVIDAEFIEGVAEDD